MARKSPDFAGNSPESVSPLIIVGATTSGKSAVAREIADSIGGHLIHADKFFLYASRTFMLGLGLDRGELDDGRPRHLYGALRPKDEPLTDKEYLETAISAVNLVHDAGRIAVIEGCIRSYTHALIGHYGLHHAVGLTCEDKQTMRPLIERRGAKLVDMGLYDEAEQAYKHGHTETFPVREGFIYRHAIAVVRGIAPESHARQLMVEGGLALAIAQDRTYTSMPGLHVITHDQHRPDMVAEQILTHKYTSLSQE